MKLLFELQTSWHEALLTFDYYTHGSRNPWRALTVNVSIGNRLLHVTLVVRGAAAYINHIRKF
jgi:hypothetical protein